MNKVRPRTEPTVVSSQKVRVTFILSNVEIQTLEQLVLSKKQSTSHVSSFTVVCGHIWSCLAKLDGVVGADVADDDPDYLNPPLPQTYLGNCLAIVMAQSTNGRLKGKDGVVAAAREIGEAVDAVINDERGVMHGSGLKVEVVHIDCFRFGSGEEEELRPFCSYLQSRPPRCSGLIHLLHFHGSFYGVIESIT